MSLAASAKAYACQPRTATAKLILMWLADYADENMRAPALLHELSMFAMCSVVEASHELQAMDDDGFIHLDNGVAVLFGGAA